MSAVTISTQPVPEWLSGFMQFERDQVVAGDEKTMAAAYVRAADGGVHVVALAVPPAAWRSSLQRVIGEANATAACAVIVRDTYRSEGGLTMGKIISIVISGVVGLALSGFAAWGVVSANTAAPSHNPAAGQVVDYGGR